MQNSTKVCIRKTHNLSFKMGIEIILGAFFVVLWKRMEWDEEEAQFSLFSLCIELLFKHIESGE